MLTPDEHARYSRHIQMHKIGLSGQEKLRQAKVLIVGIGGLGSPVALYLAAAGVGRIGIVDCDQVEVSNLQRQVLYGSSSVGKSKVQEAKNRLSELNPCIEIVTYESLFNPETALSLVREYDLVVDGTDNFPTRYLVNDTCLVLGKPNFYGSVFQFEGQVSVFATSNGPCYRCLFPEAPPAGMVPGCGEIGVLGVVPAIIGTLQATEVLKWILGLGTCLEGNLLLVNTLSMNFRNLQIEKVSNCRGCADRLESLCYQDDYWLSGRSENEISPRELHAIINGPRAPLLVDVRTSEEHQVANLGGLSIPLQELGERHVEIEISREIVVYCHHGSRSRSAMQILRKLGFKNVKSLGGGIDRWSVDVDPTLTRY
jgi:sulfur-carrier protein adenylyltransferase/sulfurtransferase